MDLELFTFTENILSVITGSALSKVELAFRSVTLFFFFFLHYTGIKVQLQRLTPEARRMKENLKRQQLL